MSTVAAKHSEIAKQPLKDLLQATHHGKWTLKDFAETAIDQELSVKRLSRPGKTRELLIPSEKLKAFHEFLRLFLIDFLPVNEEVVFSYRKGVGAFDAVSRHAQSKAFFICDIAEFFPSIRRSRVRSTFIAATNLSPIADIEHWVDRISGMVCVNEKLPVGFSTSPAISNAALKVFDDALKKYCDKQEFVVTRYSDDIIVSAQNVRELKQVELHLKAILHETMDGEFSLHPKKSKLLHTGMKVKLLGMVILPNGTVSVDVSVKKELEVLIHFFSRDKRKFASVVGGDVRRGEARVSGLLNYVNSVDEGYLDKLRKKFGVTVIDYFLHRSFS